MPSVAVPARPHNPHPLIARWLGDEKRACCSPIFPRTRHSRYADPLEKRRLRLLNAIFQALEASGFKIKSEPQTPAKFQVTLDGNTVRSLVVERIRQVRRALTAEDHARYPGLKRQYAVEKVRMGELYLTIQNYLSAWLSSKWHDEGDRALDHQLREILAGIILAATYKIKQAQLRAADERVRWEAQKQKWEQERQEKLEKGRRDAFAKIVKDWRNAGVIRTFVAALRKAVEAGEFQLDMEEFGPSINWALEGAKRMDPIVTDWSLRQDLFEHA